MERHVYWSAVEWVGLEHLALRSGLDGHKLDGLVLAELESGPVRLRYRVECGADWAVRSLRVEHLGGGGSLALRRDEAGRWTREGGEHLPSLAGAIDVDIAVTPATNTLPIRRLGLAPGETREITVVYVDVPSLEVRPMAQSYTRLDDEGPRAVYRYESATYRTELEVDDAGLVLDYPGIWVRADAGPAALS